MRPKEGYFLSDGTKVPSVTTVISRFKDSGGLIWWAWDLGKRGLDYRKVRDEAAAAGSLAHQAIDAWINQQPFEFLGPSEQRRAAETAFKAFRDWAERSGLRIDRTETPLVSERYRFGGTFDAVTLGNTPAIVDWKTSNKCYGEYLVQLAAYGALWNENHPDTPITGGFHLLRFDKQFGDFHHHHWAELDRAWTAFRHLRSLWDISRELEARAS
jgi:hypothetical protein